LNYPGTPGAADDLEMREVEKEFLNQQERCIDEL
jgi:hypothetical protein